MKTKLFIPSSLAMGRSARGRGYPVLVAALLIVLQTAIQLPVFAAPPFFEAGTLQASGHSDQSFGRWLEIDGDVLVVGASGAAYVFERALGGEWIETARLEASDGDLRFGTPVSVSGNRLLVSGRVSGRGAVHVFEKSDPGEPWHETAILTASDADPEVGANFGNSISLSGGKAIIGASSASDHIYRAGAAYIFEMNEIGEWEEVIKLTDVTPREYGYFGRSVAISGDLAVVGAPDRFPGSGRGSASVFRRNDQGVWSLDDVLVAGINNFGFAVATDGQRLAIKEYRGPRNIHIFEPVPDGWHGTPVPASTDLGFLARSVNESALAMDDNIVVAGYSHWAHTIEYTDSAGWRETRRMGASGRYPISRRISGYGNSASVSGDVMAVGFAAINTVYLYERSYEYADWIASFGVDDERPVGDPDGDGIWNEIEWQNGTHPGRVDTPYLQVDSINGFMWSDLAFDPEAGRLISNDPLDRGVVKEYDLDWNLIESYSVPAIETRIIYGMDLLPNGNLLVSNEYSTSSNNWKTVECDRSGNLVPAGIYIDAIAFDPIAATESLQSFYSSWDSTLSLVSRSGAVLDGFGLQGHQPVELAFHQRTGNIFTFDGSYLAEWESSGRMVDSVNIRTAFWTPNQTTEDHQGLAVDSENDLIYLVTDRDRIEVLKIADRTGAGSAVLLSGELEDDAFVLRWPEGLADAVLESSGDLQSWNTVPDVDASGEFSYSQPLGPDPEPIYFRLRYRVE